MKNEAAVALGRMNRGIPKTMSLAAIEQRRNAGIERGKMKSKEADEKYGVDLGFGVERATHISRMASMKRRSITSLASQEEKRVIRLWISSWRNKPFVICYWCLAKVRGKDAHADHVITLAKGGKHNIGNLCVSCSKCNHEKHAHTIAAWNQKLSEPVLL